MRALTIFIDEQWLAAVSEKDMSVPSHIIAKDLTEKLPLEVQYLGVTKSTYIYNENVLDEEKAVYYLRQILQNRFEMDYDVQEAIINYRISAISDEDEDEDEDESGRGEPETGDTHKRKSSGKESHTEKLTGFEEGGGKEGSHEIVFKKRKFLFIFFADSAIYNIKLDKFIFIFIFKI